MLMTMQVKHNKTSFEKYRTGQDSACHGKWTIVGMRGMAPSVQTARQLL